MIRLYHESNVAIEQIDLSRSKRGKDSISMPIQTKQKRMLDILKRFLYTRNEYDKKHLLSMFFQNIIFVNPENFRIFAPFR